MKKAVIYIHGKDGYADEAGYYSKFFDDEYDVIGFDYKSRYPWDAKEEFVGFFNLVGEKYDQIILIANSIGAFYSMTALADKAIKKAYFISPIVDMERFILDIMKLANVTEKELEEKKEIDTPYCETLTWKYLSYVRENPLIWNTPTCILYGEKDGMMSLDTVANFAKKTNAKLTVMADGEHWFHTQEQKEFLDNWMMENI